MFRFLILSHSRVMDNDLFKAIAHNIWELAISLIMNSRFVRVCSREIETAHEVEIGSS